MSYSTFTRTWWKDNPKYPKSLEPCLGSKKYHGRKLTYGQALTCCKDWNATHKPGRLSRKMECEEN